ncbi:MAG: hypothetical protein AB7U41_01100 [Dongiaceae bacterium]
MSFLLGLITGFIIRPYIWGGVVSEREAVKRRQEQWFDYSHDGQNLRK